MEQSVNRRGFLGAAIGTGAVAAIAPTALAHGGDGGHGGGSSGGSVPRNRRSSQLYSWRRLMDPGMGGSPEPVLKALAEMGYSQVETAGHYGWTSKEYRRVLDRYGLWAHSGHDGFDIDPANNNWQEDYKKSLQYAAELGQKFTGFAWFPPPYNEESRFRFLARRFNEAGALAKRFGLQFFYHNHDFEFSNKQANGEPMYDILLNETDARLVKFELDLYWIVYGKEDPNRYLAADPARWPLYHVKDKTWRDRKETQPHENWEDVGPGSIDFPQIFDSGEGRRLDKQFVIEHDWPLYSHPGDPKAELKTAAVGVEYLRNVRW